jgi:hypothetical protein
MQSMMHVDEIRPRKDERGIDPISDVLPFGRLLLWCTERGQKRAVRYTNSRSQDAVIRINEAASNVIETHEHKGDFKEW